jgi:hypothetical protein
VVAGLARRRRRRAVGRPLAGGPPSTLGESV